MTAGLGTGEAIGAGLLQGVAIVFPISGLGHAVLVSHFARDAGEQIAPLHAPQLFAVLRVAVALALFAYFWRDWLRVLTGLAGSLTRPRALRPHDRLAWSMVLASIPGCVAVAVLAPLARPLAGHPDWTAAALAGNGLFMLLLWWWWRRSPRAGGLSGSHRARESRSEGAESATYELGHLLPLRRAVLLGIFPVAGVVPGVSGMAITVGAGLVWGLTHELAARAAMLVLAPVLLTWGLRSGAWEAVRGGGHGALLIGAAVALVTGYAAAAFLVRYFHSASLRPFAYYCVVAGVAAGFALTRM